MTRSLSAALLFSRRLRASPAPVPRQARWRAGVKRDAVAGNGAAAAVEAGAEAKRPRHGKGEEEEEEEEEENHPQPQGAAAPGVASRLALDTRALADAQARVAAGGGGGAYGGYVRLLVGEVRTVGRESGGGRRLRRSRSGGPVLVRAASDTSALLTSQRLTAAGVRRPGDKVLRAFDEAADREVAIVLRDEWADTPVRVGDIVHLVTVDSERLFVTGPTERHRSRPDWGDCPVAAPSRAAARTAARASSEGVRPPLPPSLAPPSSSSATSSSSSSSRAAASRSIREALLFDGASLRSSGPGGASTVVVDGAHNLLVVHPDCLISGTTVAGSFPCPRKAVLSELLRGGGTSVPALRGVMAHELLQAAMRSRKYDEASVREEAARVLSDHAALLLSVNETDESAREYLDGLVPRVARFGARHVRPPAAGARPETVTAQFVADIEDNVWSPMFGLKGKIDATVGARVRGDPRRRAAEEAADGRVSGIMPLEIKTSKRPDMAHRLQVMLYTLLIADRYDQRVTRALLHYVPSEDTSAVVPDWTDVRELVRRRNRLAAYLSGAGGAGGAGGPRAPADVAAPTRRMLPPMLMAPSTCARCFQRFECMVYHKAFEGGTAASSGCARAFEEAAAGLTARHCEYLVRWHSAIELEARFETARRDEIWSVPAARREEDGQAVGGLVMVRDARAAAPDGSALYTFRRQDGAAAPARRFCLRERDVVVVGTDGPPPRVPRPLVAVAVGTVFAAGDGRITVRVRGAGPAALERERRSTAPGHQLWRIDRDEYSTSHRSMKYNVLSLFAPDGDQQEKGIGGAAWLRGLVVDLERPAFGEDLPPEAHLRQRAERLRRFGSLAPGRGMPAGSGRLLADYARLNSDQRRAVRRVLASRDYTLVLGMPGTGKTSTIVLLVRVLVALGQSVLLTAYTHSAVDNLLLKLREAGCPFLRVGRPSQVHPDLRDACRASPAAGEGDGPQTVAALAAVVDSPDAQVVGCTCLGAASSPLLARRRFDVCVVDEASQLTQPVCLGPLRSCRRFVLVGDHYQLPPLVRDPAAREAGLGVSLFRSLSEAHPSATVSLTLQYRMCREIAELSSRYVYGGLLRCGSQAVAEARLALPLGGFGDDGGGGAAAARPAGLVPFPRMPPAADWLPRAVDPARPAVFLDTARCSPGGEGGEAARERNPAEAALVVCAVVALLSRGVSPDEIGVISPYRAQLRLLRALMDGAGAGAAEGLGRVEALTVDRYQGRDKQCILVSFVRSPGGDGSLGDLLQDWRRVNVAFTRAKHKLVLFGAASLLSRAPMLGACIAHMRERGLVDALPPAAHLDSYPAARELFERASAL